MVNFQYVHFLLCTFGHVKKLPICSRPVASVIIGLQRSILLCSHIFCDFDNLFGCKSYIYRPYPKDGEGHVFIYRCLLKGGGGGIGTPSPVTGPIQKPIPGPAQGRGYPLPGQEGAPPQSLRPG